MTDYESRAGGVVGGALNASEVVAVLDDRAGARVEFADDTGGAGACRGVGKGDIALIDAVHHRADIGKTGDAADALLTALSHLRGVGCDLAVVYAVGHGTLADKTRDAADDDMLCAAFKGCAGDRRLVDAGIYDPAVFDSSGEGAVRA